MADILIVYGSTTGNTSDVADKVSQVLSAAGHNCVLKDVAVVAAKGLFSGYDAVLFGCSTWGQEELELQDDFIPLYEDLATTEPKAKLVAVFGCGDSFYTYYCGAVDAIEQRLQELGAKLLAPGLKIDGEPSMVEEDIEAWAAQIAKAL